MNPTTTAVVQHVSLNVHCLTVLFVTDGRSSLL